MSREAGFVIKGGICYSKNRKELVCIENGCLVCEDGLSAGVFRSLPEKYKGLPLYNFSNSIVIPGLTDLHIHAPQFANRGMALDLELLEWLEKYTFPEEAKFDDIGYAEKAYGMFAEELRKSATTRACVFGTVHVQATLLLMDKLEKSGLVTYVGKVNMDRNSPEYIKENTEDSLKNTVEWLAQASDTFERTKPILTPRFVPACSDALLDAIGRLAAEYGLPVQSHLSENPDEVEWVKQLCPWASSYGEAYARWGLFGNGVKTIMAHCVWSGDDETALMKQNGVTIAHCPASNCNLASGIAPVRRYLDEDIKTGLATDVSAGESTSILKAMASAIAMSKIRRRYVDSNASPVSMEEAFFMGTAGGGAFFGNTGSFEKGYELDAVVIDDSPLTHPQELRLKQRLERIICLSDNCNIVAKFVRGTRVV